MHDPPDFLQAANSIHAPEIFRPHPTVRRGELLAWITTLLIGVAMIFVLRRTKGISIFSLVIFFTLFLIAVLISFGNWVDRRTSIRITPESVSYQSPIRKVELDFNDIESLWAIPTGRGWRILVRGEGRLFHFQTAHRLTFRSRGEMNIGVEGGDRLAGIIRQHAGLSPPEFIEGAWICRRYQGPV